MMYEQEKKQSQKPPQKYYPASINEPQTQNKLKILNSTMHKILNKPVKHNRVPAELLQKISSYIFPNPIILAYPLYQKMRKNGASGAVTVNVGAHSGMYLLYDLEREDCFRVEIRKYWRRLDKGGIGRDRVMRLAGHLDDFLELRNNPFEEQGSSKTQKWKIVSQNNHYYLGVLKILTKYKKDTIINDQVIKSYSQIMNHHLLLLTLNSQHYLLIHPNPNPNPHLHQTPRNLALNLHKKSKISFDFQQNSLQLISNDYDVYAPSSRVMSRNRQVLLDWPKCGEIFLDDVFIGGD